MNTSRYRVIQKFSSLKLGINIKKSTQRIDLIFPSVKTTHPNFFSAVVMSFKFLQRMSKNSRGLLLAFKIWQTKNKLGFTSFWMQPN